MLLRSAVPTRLERNVGRTACARRGAVKLAQTA
jgi:hypothetical protein